jgi:Transmembrane domain of unknown function (DUF3566)
MTQPSHPAPTTAGRPTGNPPPAPSSQPEPSRSDRGSRGRERPDPGQFSYETVSAAGRPGTTLPPPPETAVPAQAYAPPSAFRPDANLTAPTPHLSAPPLTTPAPPAGASPLGTPAAGGPNGAPALPRTRAGRSRAGTTARPNVRLPRRARLQLRHINPWTVFKFSCALSIALFLIWLLSVGALYGVLEATGVVGRINDAVTTIDGPGSTPPIRIGVVFLSALAIGVVNIVLFIALSTIGSIVYNLLADLIGGVEVTLSERES